MDWKAVTSLGVYSDAATSAARAAFAVSYGLLDEVPEGVIVVASVTGLYPSFFSGMWCCEREPRNHPVTKNLD